MSDIIEQDTTKEAHKVNILTIIKNSTKLIITTKELEDLLEYFESSEIEWHQQRGLVSTFGDKGRIFAMTSRFPRQYPVYPNVMRNILPFNNNLRTHQYKHEVHEIPSNTRYLK